MGVGLGRKVKDAKNCLEKQLKVRGETWSLVGNVDGNDEVHEIRFRRQAHCVED